MSNSKQIRAKQIFIFFRFSSCMPVAAFKVSMAPLLYLWIVYGNDLRSEISNFDAI